MVTKKKTNQISAPEILNILCRKNKDFAALLDPELLDLMTKSCTVERFEPPEALVTQHNPSDSVFIILDGRCVVNVNDENLGFLDPGDMLGEMGVIQNTPRSASVIASESTSALRIPGEVFKSMLDTPGLSAWVMKLLTNRLRSSSTEAARVRKEMEEILHDQKELARVQRSLLPKQLPEDPRAHIHVLYNPCAYAGGDYYDAIMLDDNLLFLIVADVTGHGAQASISMAIVRSFIHQGNLGKTPHTTLKRLNRYLLDYGPTQHFVTAQAAVIDLEKKYIHVAYAGHPPILHLRAASCQPIKAPRAFFLRFRPDADFKSGGLQLLPGDRILFYTDGVIETFDPDGQMYNIEGMQQFLEKNHDQPVSALPTALETDLHRFSQGSPMEDDITFMVIEMV